MSVKSVSDILEMCTVWYIRKDRLLLNILVIVQKKEFWFYVPVRTYILFVHSILSLIKLRTVPIVYTLLLGKKFEKKLLLYRS